MEALNKAWEGAAQEMYAASGAEGGAAQDAGAAGADQDSGSAADNNVSDVEYEEVDDNSKK